MHMRMGTRVGAVNKLMEGFTGTGNYLATGSKGPGLRRRLMANKKFDGSRLNVAHAGTEQDQDCRKVSSAACLEVHEASS